MNTETTADRQALDYWGVGRRRPAHRHRAVPVRPVSSARTTASTTVIKQRRASRRSPDSRAIPTGRGATCRPVLAPADEEMLMTAAFSLLTLALPRAGRRATRLT